MAHQSIQSIQSIPTVVAFNKKQIVDGFQGVLPKSKIIKFIEKVTGKPFPQNKKEFYNNIKKLITISIPLPRYPNEYPRAET